MAQVRLWVPFNVCSVGGRQSKWSRTGFSSSRPRWWHSPVSCGSSAERTLPRELGKLAHTISSWRSRDGLSKNGPEYLGLSKAKALAQGDLASFIHPTGHLWSICYRPSTVTGPGSHYPLRRCSVTSRPFKSRILLRPEHVSLLTCPCGTYHTCTELKSQLSPIRL